MVLCWTGNYRKRWLHHFNLYQLYTVEDFLSDQRFTVTLSAADLKVCNAVFSDFLPELLGTWDFPFYASVIFFFRNFSNFSY